jgi:enoyl-CoA hydratase
MDQAMAREFAFGLDTLRSGEAVSGAARFASGRGRGGNFSDI